MAEQVDMFATDAHGYERATVRVSPAPAYVSEDCRREAKRAIEPKAARLRSLVFEALKAAPLGLTREELETATGLDGNTLRPRVWELVKAGRICEVGATRPTRSGKNAAILVVAR